MPSPKLDWSSVEHDRLDAARRLYEAGAPVHAVAAATGLTEPSILRQAKKDGWVAPEALKRIYSDAVEHAVTVRAKEARASSALSISPAEAEELIETLGSRDVTLPERANQYTAIMARVAMRVAVMHLSMTDNDLLNNADKLMKLDVVARKTLSLTEAPAAPPSLSGPRSSHTTVNVMATAGPLPPLLSGEASVKLVQEKVLFETGGLPPIREAAASKIDNSAGV